jgi:RNA polymerase primary sigma factor
VQKIAPKPISLDTPASDDDLTPWGHSVEDRQTLSPSDIAEKQSLVQTVAAAMSELPEREADVIRMRFGIDMDTESTLEEVGKMYGVTRERIRQIESKALRKLRHPARSGPLKTFTQSEKETSAKPAEADE